MPKRRAVLNAVLLSFCLLPCLAAEGFSWWPEFWLSSDCLSGTAYGTQSSPALARGEDNLLIVWEDQRIFTQRDVFATRITSEGEVLDPIGIPVCTVAGQQTSVRAAAGDQNYLVVWQDRRGVVSEIYAARIDFEGNVLDPDGFQITSGSGWAESPDVAWDGTDFMVVWSHDRYQLTSYDVYATRVSPDGEILDPRGVQLSFDDVMELYPSISCNDSICFVVWEHALG